MFVFAAPVFAHLLRLVFLTVRGSLAPDPDHPMSLVPSVLVTLVSRLIGHDGYQRAGRPCLNVCIRERMTVLAAH